MPKPVGWPPAGVGWWDQIVLRFTGRVCPKSGGYPKTTVLMRKMMENDGILWHFLELHIAPDLFEEGDPPNCEADLVHEPGGIQHL